MTERLSQPDPEQLALGGLLAIIIDEGLEFDPGYFEDDDIEDVVGRVLGSLYEEGHDAPAVLVNYGVIENYEEV